MTKVIHDRRAPEGTERFSRRHDFDAETDPSDFDAAHELFSDLRARCPVAHSNDMEGFWMLTRYEDIETAMSDPALYSTAVQNVVPRVATTGRRPPLHLDPPEHTPYRKAIAPLFRKERMQHWNKVVREISDRLFKDIPAMGRADICGEFSFHLPIHVLAEFFMISEEDAFRIRNIGHAFNLALQTKDFDAIQKHSLVLYDIAQGIIDDRKNNPRDPGADPASALLAARDFDGEPLPDQGILGTIRQLLVVGIIAPTTFLGSAAVHFCRHPEHFQLLKDHPEKTPQITEELLRLYTPYRGFARTPTRDVEIGGEKICKDEPIALCFTSANRDETVFDCPHEFRLDRDNPKPAIAFGRGPHRCAGEPIGRLMIEAALESWAKYCNGFAADGPTPMTTWPEYGPFAVPVRFL